MQATVVGYKVGGSVKMPSDGSTENVKNDVIEYKLSPEELEQYRSNTKVNKVQAKQRNLGRWQHKDNRMYTVHIEWEMSVINKIINMWVDGIPIDQIGKSVSKDVDELGMILIQLAKEGNISTRPGGVFGSGLVD
jgi:hypothetical protein